MKASDEALLVYPGLTYIAIGSSAVSFVYSYVFMVFLERLSFHKEKWIFSNKFIFFKWLPQFIIFLPLPCGRVRGTQFSTITLLSSLHIYLQGALLHVLHFWSPGLSAASNLECWTGNIKPSHTTCTSCIKGPEIYMLKRLRGRL